MSEDSGWPTIDSVKAELLEREREARCRAHYKGGLDRSDQYFYAKEIAAEQDA